VYILSSARPSHFGENAIFFVLSQTAVFGKTTLYGTTARREAAGGRFTAAVRYTFSGASEINLGEKRIDRTNCPLDPGGAGRRRFSRLLQRFMRLGTVAKKLFATELAAATAAEAVVSKIRFNSSVRVSVCAYATIVQQRPLEATIKHDLAYTTIAYA